MNERERSAKATEKVHESGIECVIDSAIPESITVLCGGGVMAYFNGNLLMLGEHVPLTENPVSIFVNDVVNHRQATILV